MTDEQFSKARHQMVRDQLAAITDQRVIRAMQAVPRHRFVPANVRELAYNDRALPIGFDQTISQPYVVAFMTAHLQTKPSDRILEIGTGSGYQAAILAQLVAHVYTIEIVSPLAERAREAVESLGLANISVRNGDGFQGWPDTAPFDGIIVTCAPQHIPQPLVEQLREGGRMIIPIGPIGEQELVLLRKTGNGIEQTAVLPVRFVPMTGEAAR
jgi:protein-L-isoaspartate(D-aspartate) O-methyltransferase